MSKSGISQANVTGCALVSKCVIGPPADTPEHSPAQKLSRSDPTGVFRPIPVMATGARGGLVMRWRPAST